jgi:hypothetical protein
MVNHIRKITIHNRRLDPTAAELELWTDLEKVTSATEIRARLLGPHCRYSTTIELAYPFREEFRDSLKTPVVLSRAMVPEPNLWGAGTPFLYTCHAELWEAGQLCDQAQIRLGLRTLNVGAVGLHWNGQGLALRGVRRNQCSPEEGLRLHQSGCNLFLTALTPETEELWRMAEEVGFVMLGTIGAPEGYKQLPAVEKSPSCFGWVLAEHLLNDPQVRAQHYYTVHGNKLFGVELSEKPRLPLPKLLRFVVCEESRLPMLAEVSLPKIVLSPGEFGADEARAPQAGFLGWVYR